MSWNEAFSRAAMFLSALTGAVVALALVAQASAFGEGFVTFALLILPVVLLLGVATFVRLVEINHEDVRWVIGMNLLRNAYLEAAPELRPYFITGWHDDEGGIMATFGARPGPGGFAHEFVTTPGVLAVIDGVLAGVIAGIVGPRLGVPTSIAPRRFGRGRPVHRRGARDLPVSRRGPASSAAARSVSAKGGQELRTQPSSRTGSERS